MTVSIVITTHNRLPLLRRAVSSALTQTLPCEIVVADDRSTDGTDEYIQRLIQLVGDRVVYCRTKTEFGHSAAMNLGVAKATGDWIKPLDDDDYLAPDCLAAMMAVLKLHPQAAIASCQAIQVNEAEQEIGRSRLVGGVCEAQKGYRASYIPQAEIHAGMLLEQVPFGTTTQVMFRRDAFLRSDGWDTALPTVCDDIDSWIRIAQFGDAMFLNECLAYRTIWHGAQNQHFSLQKRRDLNWLMKQKIYALIPAAKRSTLPTLTTVQRYLDLHWGMVALKQRQMSAAIQLAFPAVLDRAAWQLLIQIICQRRNPALALLPQPIRVLDSHQRSFAKSTH